MATHPIGPGTCNLSINAPKSWRRFLGRRALMLNVSMGELVRRLILRASYVWKASAVALSAKQADLEAFEILRCAIADGVQAEDLPKIQDAMALILKSANTDGEIAESLDVQEVVNARA